MVFPLCFGQEAVTIFTSHHSHINPNDKEWTERRPLNHITEFNEFLPYVNNDLTTEFMRFAAKYFTNNQKDPKHNPSTKSCLIRVLKPLIQNTILKSK